MTAAATEQLLTGRGTSLSARAIAAHANANDAAKLALLRELETFGQVRREGSRGTTAWRLIGEDPIAQRAPSSSDRPPRRAHARPAHPSAPEHPSSQRQPRRAGRGFRRKRGS